MLENFFGSKTRVKLLNLFFNNTEACFYAREIARNLKHNINSIRREIINLEKIGIIKQSDWKELDISEEELIKAKKEKKKYYQVNKDFVLFDELKNLIIKSKLLVDQATIEKLKNIPGVKLLLLSGVFVNDNKARTDILIVGNVNKNNIKKLIGRMERSFDCVLRYSIISQKEFNYRNAMTDKFLFEIMEGKKVVVIDKLE